MDPGELEGDGVWPGKGKKIKFQGRWQRKQNFLPFFI